MSIFNFRSTRQLEERVDKQAQDILRLTKSTSERFRHAARILLHQYRTITTIMAKQQEATDRLNALATQIDKLGTETSSLVTKVGELQAAAAAGDVPDNVMGLINSLADHVQRVDDMVPDAPAPADAGGDTGAGGSTAPTTAADAGTSTTGDTAGATGAATPAVEV
jgi:hypothetical protein